LIALVAVIAVVAVVYVFTHRGATGTEITTPSGLKYVELVEGTGAPSKGQTVSVKYVGTLRVEPSSTVQPRVVGGGFQIGVGRVIKGWDEAL
jgi:peptidylprolyl isomerase